VSYKIKSDKANVASVTKQSMQRRITGFEFGIASAKSASQRRFFEFGIASHVFAGAGNKQPQYGFLTMTVPNGFLSKEILKRKADSLI
jgi:hypothetical protein